MDPNSKALEDILKLLCDYKESPPEQKAVMSAAVDVLIRARLHGHVGVSVREMREFIVHEYLPAYWRRYRNQSRPEVKK